MTTRYVIVCRDYTSKPYATEDAAQRALDRIIESGECPLDHDILPTDGGRPR